MIHEHVLPFVGEASEEEKTQNRAIVFLHGWGQTHSSLLPLARLMTGIGTCHVLDLPGFGASETPPDNWSTLDYANCVSDWMAARGIARADLVGHSFGGRVSVRIAAHFPEKVRSIVLIGAAGLRPKRGIKARMRIGFSFWLGKLGRLLPTPLRQPLLRWRATTFGSADFNMAQGAMRTILSRVVSEDLAPEASRIRAPALLIYGRLDDQTPVEMGQRYRGLIQGSELIVLESQGHYAFAGGGAHQCATHLKRFYQGTGTMP